MPALLRIGARTLLIAALGGLLSATLVRFAPGFGHSEEQLDPRRSASSIGKLSASREDERDVFTFYLRFLGGYFSGDLGESSLFRRPVRELVAERAAPTVAIVAMGLAAAWTLALLVGIPAGRQGGAAPRGAARVSALLLQSLPAAVVGLLVLASGTRGEAACAGAVALLLYPRLVQYVLNLVEDARDLPHVLAARARGIGGAGLLVRHELPAVAGPLAALAGISVSMALSVAIPLEMILDVPGLGQLTWQAALGRDMTLLVNMTVLMSVLITAANAAAGPLAARGRGREEAE